MSGFVLIDGVAHALPLTRDGAGMLRLAGAPLPAVAPITTRAGDGLWVHLDGRAWELFWQDAVTHFEEEAGGHDSDTARAPMPGAVVVLNVAPGDAVNAGDTMLVIESMKLETAIRAARDGVVATVGVQLGQTFERGAVLVELEALA